MGDLELFLICADELGATANTNVYGLSPLHLSAAGTISEDLIKKGADVNCQDENGWTPLHHAVYNGQVEVARVLVDSGADLFVRDADYDTAYDLLCKCGTRGEALEQLLEDANRRYVALHFTRGVIVDADSENDSEGPSESTLSNDMQRKLSTVLLKDSHRLSDFGVDLIKYSELAFREELGSGGSGTVHRGYYHDTEVAIKVVRSEVLSEKTLALFIKEIQSLLKIRHNRFVQILALCIDGPICLVMELVKGGTLLDAITLNRFSYREKLIVSLQICEGLGFIHTKDPTIVHRDIKPQNILVDEYQASVKIADLGLTRSLTDFANTTMEFFAGTVRYMAPELYDERPECGAATDIWAFGCLLYQLFSGKLPWAGLELTGIQRRLILKQEFPIDAQLPEDVLPLIKGCCAVEPKNRVRAKDLKVLLMRALGIQNSQTSL